MSAADPEEYSILDQFHSELQQIKIIHVGAGASGLLTAYKARKLLKNYELICYEKNSWIGGTWLENRYPGCACDIPAHTYTFTFEPNSEWSGFYSYSGEIQKYMEDFYKKHQLEEYMKFDTEVLEAIWRDLDGEWEVKLKRGGEVFTDRCHVLINGSGVLTKWKWPTIDGLKSFKGALSHSAAWDTSLDWTGKSVAVIGTGSSAIQMVPHLAKGSKGLTIFARNQTWIAPQIASDTQAVAATGEPSGAAGKHHYVEAEKKRFRSDPAFFLDYRQKLEARVLGGFPLFLRGSRTNVGAKEMMRQRMLARLGDSPAMDEFKERFIPSWSPGCRRLTPGEGFLETISSQPHVNVIHGEIASFTETGLVTADGQSLDFDIIACATGFDIGYVPHFKITGVDGVVMSEDWAESPNIYLSITAPKFPNYFTINGPTGNWGQGCALPSHEVQIEYALQCCRKVQEDGIKALEVRQAPTTQINEHLDKWHKQYSVWAEDCRSWYKKDGRVLIWPGSLLHHLKTLQTPRFEHYDVRYREENMWAFLGHGRTELEIKAEREGTEKVVLAPYIRNEDVEWSLEVRAEQVKSGAETVEESVEEEERKEQATPVSREVRANAGAVRMGLRGVERTMRWRALDFS